MRRLPLPVTALAACLALAGCGGGEEQAAPQGPAARAEAAVASLRGAGFERTRTVEAGDVEPRPAARFVVAGARSAGDLDVLVYRDAAAARAGLRAVTRTPAEDSFVSVPSRVVGATAYRARGPESDAEFARDVRAVERALAG